MSSPNLLMISYFYPPAATGVRRLLSLVRHLPEHGWHPMILACREAVGEGYDPLPLEDPAISSVPVVRVGSLDPYRLRAKVRRRRSAGGGSAAGKTSGGSRSLMRFARNHLFLPDDRMGWIPFAAAEGIKLVCRHKIRAIYSSNYPQSAHVAAMIVHRCTGVPWIADFRDGWTQNPVFYGHPNFLLAKGQHALERRTARRANRIVTVSPPITRHLQSLRPAGPPPVETIFNGFEPSEFPETAVRPPLHPGKFTLLYTGTFFGERKPDEFIAALRLMLQEHPEWGAKLKVRFRCAFDARERALIEGGNLDEVVEVLPPIPHRDIVSEQQRADGFLLILERGPGAEIMVSQKVFEYLACGRPVFAIIPAGAALEVLQQTGGATICTSQEIPIIAQELNAFLESAASGTHPLPSREAVRQFERPREAAEFARILDEMTGRADKG